MQTRAIAFSLVLTTCSTTAWLASCVGSEDASPETTSNGDSGSDAATSDVVTSTDSGSGADTGCGDITSSNLNCGGCGNACAAGVNCNGGVCGGNDVVQVLMGGYFGCVVLKRGDVWCWGGDNENQLGPLDAGPESCQTGPCRVEPKPIAGLSNVKQITSGGEFLCALKNDGTVWCWGSAARGELGGDAIASGFPQQVPSLTGVTQIASAGYFSMCAVTSGAVYCWGNDFGGQLGRGTTPGSDPTLAAPTPEAVVSLPSNVVEVHGANGDPGSPCARTDDGGVWCWGCNFWGTLGHDRGLDTPTTTYYSNYCNSTPLLVDGVSATALIGGDTSWCAKTAAGTVTCWGFNGFAADGRSLGGDEAANTVPETVAGLPQLSPANQGETHGKQICAIDSTGSLWCWGDEQRGELGDGVYAGGSVDAGQVLCVFDGTSPCNGAPHKIAQPAAFASHKVVQFSGSGYYGGDQWATVALLDDGSVWTWGANGWGQLGARTGVGADSTCAGGVPCNAVPAQLTGLPAR